jgi:hypothetical protein
MWRKYTTLASLLVFSGAGVWLVSWILSDADSAPESAKTFLPDEMRLKLVETLKKESWSDTVKNLPNYDDCVYTMGSVSEMEGAYAHSRLYFPRLNRVKRILEQRAVDPAALEKALKDKLTWATKEFPKARRAELEKLRESPIHAKEPSEADSCVTYGGACTYLFSEMRVQSALPLMLKIMERKSSVPVNRLFLFYAMHRLVVTHPNEHLSPDATQAQAAYLKSVTWLPPPERVSVASALALVDEGDLRHQLLGLDVGVGREPHLEIEIFPALPMIEEDPRYGNSKVPQLKEPLALLKGFIERAYPRSVTQDERDGKK